MWRCDKNFLPHTHTYHYTTAATRSNQFIYAFWPQAVPNAAAAAGAAEDDGGGGEEGGSPEGHCLFTTRSTSKNDKCQVRSHSLASQSLIGYRHSFFQSRKFPH